MFRVLGFSGSRRKDSYNTALIKAAAEVAPDNLEIRIYEYEDIPFYNADLDTDDLRPASVNALKNAMAEADGILIATPEYSHSLPGGLKNMLDWASRPGGKSPLNWKPAGLMSASPGAIGGTRAQEHLLQVYHGILMRTMPHGGIVVGNAAEKFEEGRLTHEATRSFLAKYLKQFADWINLLQEKS